MNNNENSEPLDPFRAVGIIEGFIEENDEKKIIEAWQYLVDTGLAWRLEGRFGRRANAMIEQGLIKLAGSNC